MRLLAERYCSAPVPMGRRRYEERGDSVVVRFQPGGAKGGAEGGSEWEAQLVVGADGAFSAVQRHCLDDGKPDFAVSGGGCLLRWLLCGSSLIWSC